ncbi:MAG: beta-lactamase family protein [Proteobacteria bacterium]|uniref:serine hydrolase domain-containing protein n=1 Tax=Rudaea sp. TaxID=2136325 RepID=UPI003783982C|nr:beta-lactamase family protein [Pseudomonadota bacterium]
MNIGRLLSACGVSCLLLVSAAARADGPVASVRVAFDRDGITSIQTDGFADKAIARRINADDPVRVASISKLVTMIGVMRLVEAGKLELDADVSMYLGFKLRNPAFPDAPISLRLLVSHRSSLTDAAGYWQTPLDGRLRDTLADPRAWDPEHAPGTYFRYTNLNFPVVAQVMERVTGERFDRLMQRLVLKPLGTGACFGWAACDQAAAARAVVLYDTGGRPLMDDNHGRRPDCAVRSARDGSCDLSRYHPGENGALFGPQGGLRISALDLARVGMMLLGDGRLALNGERLLTPESAHAMATPTWQYDGRNGLTFEEDSDDHQPGFFCRWGMGMQILATHAEGCRDDPFADGIARIGHSGTAYGVQAGIWLDRGHGSGVVWFATGMPEKRSDGRSAFSAVEEKFAVGK